MGTVVTSPAIHIIPGSTLMNVGDQLQLYHPAVGGRIANKSTLYGLFGIAAFLLLLGCINFINLTTAHASHRAKEIGI